MNDLEAEDDGHVRAMKVKKGDRGKKGYGKGKLGKTLGMYDRSNEHSKAVREEMKEGIKSKE